MKTINKNLEKELDIINSEVKKLRMDIFTKKVAFPASEVFPLGCCGNASDILYERLLSLGIKNLEKKVNMFCGRQSHAWLEYQEYIIDITIDQFDTENRKGFILEKRKSDFHRQFKLR